MFGAVKRLIEFLSLPLPTPGLTTTRQTEKFRKTAAVRELSKDMHPLHRFADPQDVASAMHFFLSPENAFITGQSLAVDGGLSTLEPEALLEHAGKHEAST